MERRREKAVTLNITERQLTTGTANKREREITKGPCLFCENNDHQLYKCEGFLGLTVPQMWNWAEKQKLCFCCLKRGHSRSSCNGWKCGIQG